MRRRRTAPVRGGGASSRCPLPLVQACRPPEAQPAPLRPAVGPHPDVQGGGGPQGDGGPVAGDGESLDEYPPSGDRLPDLEVDLVPPVGRRPGPPGGPSRPPPPGRTATTAIQPMRGFLRLDLQRLGPVVVALTGSPRLSPCACRTSASVRCGAPCSVAGLFLRSLPRPRPTRFAIRLSGPGPLRTGCAGAGGSLLTSWATCPA